MGTMTQVKFVDDDRVPICNRWKRREFARLMGEGYTIRSAVATGHEICNRCFDTLDEDVRSRVADMMS